MEKKRVLTEETELVRAQQVVSSVRVPGYIVTLNCAARMLNMVDSEHPGLLQQQHFTPNEWTMFLELLLAYPHYVPYERLLARLTGLSCLCCRQRIQAARQEGPKVLRQELKPVYRALCGIRAKISHISPHLQITLVRDNGYVLVTSAHSLLENEPSEHLRN